MNLRMSHFNQMICIACQKNIKRFNYKNPKELEGFLNYELEIKKARHNRLCKKHQKRLSEAIKVARQLALLPYSPNQRRKYLQGN